MIKRLELRPSEQRRVLARYLRTLTANCNRAYRELLEVSRVRRGCPFERHLRYKRLDDANELLKLGKKCLDEINRCYALRLAPFSPGDQLVVKTTIPGLPPDPRRYLLLNVEWRRRDEYIYEAHELTKTGTLHKGRYPGALCPSSRISIEKCACNASHDDIAPSFIVLEI